MSNNFCQINSTELDAMTALESSNHATHNVSDYNKGTDLPEFACDDPNFEFNKTFTVQVTENRSAVFLELL